MALRHSAGLHAWPRLRSCSTLLTADRLAGLPTSRYTGAGGNWLTGSLSRSRRSGSGPGFELSARIGGQRRRAAHHQRHAGEGLAQWSLAGLDSISTRQRDPLQDRSADGAGFDGPDLPRAKGPALPAGRGADRQCLDRLGIALAPRAVLAAFERV